MAGSFGQGLSGGKASRGILQPHIVLVVLIVISLVSVTLYAREAEDGPLHTLQNSASGFVSPLKAVSGGITSAEQSIADRVADAQADPNSIVSLREQNEQMRSTIAQLEEYRQEAIRLEGILEVRNTYQAQGIPGRVLSRSTDVWNRIVTIDVGSSDGVRSGLPVMGPSGLIGQVVATTQTTADVRLITDSQSGVAVIIQSNREEGIVHGSLEGLLYLDELGAEVEVSPGDVVLTSGLGGGYFRGILLGTVLKVEGEAGATERKIIVEPNNPSNMVLEEVYVVTSMTSKAADPEEEKEGDSSQEGIDLDGDGIPDTFGMDYYTGYNTMDYSADIYGASDSGVSYG